MKKTQKILCLILSLLLVFTSISFSPNNVSAQSYEEMSGPVQLGDKMYLYTHNSSEYMYFSLTAQKAGLYSIRLTQNESQCYLSKAYENDGTTIAAYASDYRIGDKTTIDYYDLKEGETIYFNVLAKANSSCYMTADALEEIKPGQKLTFEGEYDKSYYFYPDHRSFYKFGSLIPTDSNGNNLLNSRVRYFQNENNAKLDYLYLPDVQMNSALNLTGGKPVPYIINIYSHATSYSLEDASTVKSEVQFIKMANYSGNISINMLNDPLSLIENQNGSFETTDTGNTYFKYTYSHSSFIKSYTIPFYDGDMEFPANSSAYDEKNPYSPYTGFYLDIEDTQKTEHWTVGSNNYFTINIGFDTIKVPVVIKTYDQLDTLLFYGDTNIVLTPNEAQRRYLKFTPTEGGPYTLFVTVDTPSDSCSDEILFTINKTLAYDKPEKATKLDNGKTLYEFKNLNLENGTQYTFDFYLLHTDENSATSDKPITMTLNMKNPVSIQNVKINKTGLPPVFIEGYDNPSGTYDFSLQDYVTSVDVTYSDDTVCRYTYDETTDSYTTNADAKYTVYPLIVESKSDTWAPDKLNAVNFVINGRHLNDASLSFNIISEERVLNFYSQRMNLDEVYSHFYSPYSVNTISYYDFYRFEPGTSGIYEFQMQAIPHDGNCNISTYCDVYHNGEKIATNFKADKLSPLNFKAGEQYIIKFYGVHKNCDITDMTNHRPQIQVTKISDEPETTTPNPTTDILPETTVNNATTGTLPETTVNNATTEITNENTFDNSTTKAMNENSTVIDNTKLTTGGTETASQIKSPSNSSSNNVSEPKATKFRKIKAAKKSLTILWTKVKTVKGYEIQIATDKKFKKNKKTVIIKNKNICKTTIKKLKSKKKYYIRIRTYNESETGFIYSKWLNIKSKKTK